MTRLRWAIAVAAVVALGLGILAWRVDTSSSRPGWVDCTAPEVVPRPTSVEGDAITDVAFERILDAELPTSMTFSPADGWAYVTEQVGRLLGVPPGGGPPAVVLDLSGEVADGFEQGLLGSAISPDGAWLYLNRTDAEGHTRVEAFAITAPGEVDAGSRRELLTIEQPHRMHNGGTMAVDGNEYLYIAVGDGGGLEPPDPDDNGQRAATLLGSVLRIDPTPDAAEPYRIPEENPFVDDPDARDEIWLMGLRNPWMLSIDEVTDRAWVPDVGHFCYEEINVVALADRGANLGWKRVEGVNEIEGELPDDLLFPIHVYDRESLTGDLEDVEARVKCAVVGGAVYRGTEVPRLAGGYVFSDFCDGQGRVLWEADDGVVVHDVGEPLGAVLAFATGSGGELYALTPESVERLVPAS